MQHSSGKTGSEQNILVVDNCTFRRLAICHSLASRLSGVQGLSCLENLPADQVSCVGGIVLGLHGSLGDLMHKLRVLAALLRVATVPVVLVTDMSPCCALALLTLAGVPARVSAGIRVVPSRQKITRVHSLLLTALKGSRPSPGVDSCRVTPTSLHLGVLGMLIDGSDDMVVGQAAGVAANTIYSQRYATLRRLRVTGLHALLCGRFVRPDGTPEAAFRGGRDMS